MVNITDDKVYVVIHGYNCLDDYTSNTIETKVFDTYEKAEKYMTAQYNDIVNDLYEDNRTANFGNYGDNAMIEVVVDGCLLYGIHNWYIQMKTVNYEG